MVKGSFTSNSVMLKYSHQNLFLGAILGCIADTSFSVSLSRLQLKSVETVFPQ